MLNPINTEAVIRDGGAIGRFPGEIHEGVAWWLGACFVALTARAASPSSATAGRTRQRSTSRLCRGAINAHHLACQRRRLHVDDRGRPPRPTCKERALPGAW